MDKSHNDFLARIKAKRKFFKICIVGDGATGKTTFMRFLSTGNLRTCHDNLRRTPYMDFGSTKIADNVVQIIDLAGQRFDGVHPLDHIPVTALRGADIILFFFTLDNFDSFLSLVNWYNEIRTIFDGWDSNIPSCILVGNKNDLTRCVERLNGEDFVKSYPEFSEYHEISLVSGDGVINLMAAIEQIMDQRQ